MEQFCAKCGSRLDKNYCCSFCGAKYKVKENYTVPTYGLMPGETPAKIVATLKKHEYFSSALWIVIGVIQIFLFAFAVMGVCNILLAITSLIYTFTIKPYKYEVYEYYEKRLWVIIVAIISNILMGGVFGVMGAIYDLYIRSYVLKNKYAFNRITY